MSVECRRQMIEPEHPSLSVVRQCELVQDQGEFGQDGLRRLGFEPDRGRVRHQAGDRVHPRYVAIPA